MVPWVRNTKEHVRRGKTVIQVTGPRRATCCPLTPQPAPGRYTLLSAACGRFLLSSGYTGCHGAVVARVWHIYDIYPELTRSAPRVGPTVLQDAIDAVRRDARAPVSTAEGGNENAGGALLRKMVSRCRSFSAKWYNARSCQETF